jgi:hypothetical protein
MWVSEKLLIVQSTNGSKIIGTINTTIRVLPNWKDIKINNSGKREGLVHYCNDKVGAILKETKETLRKFKKMELRRTRGAKGLRNLIANLLRRWKFSVDGEAIRERLKAIERTKSSLQSALLLVLVEQKCSTYVLLIFSGFLPRR